MPLKHIMSKRSFMKAVRCHAFAAAEQSGDVWRPRSQKLPLRQILTLETNLPRPTTCQPHEVIIQTHYAGIQYPDMLQACGLYQVKPPLPYTPGMDVAGVVCHVGKDASSLFQVGDSVMATMKQNGGTGGLAEVVIVPAKDVFQVGNDVNLAHYANIGRNYFAAYHSLRNVVTIGAGSLVLVDGASGGVGMATIELAKAMRAKVIAGVSIAEKTKYPESVGADCVLCYGSTKETFRKFKKEVQKASKRLGHADGVDLVVDMVQGPLFEAALVSCAKPLGTIALVGFTAGQVPIRPGILLIKEVNVVGSLWGRWARDHPDEHRANVEDILSIMKSGAIRPRVDRVFPLDRFMDAFELFEQNKGRGNTAISFVEHTNGSFVTSKL